MLTDSLIKKNDNPLGGKDDNKDQEASNSTDPNATAGGPLNLAKTQRPSDMMNLGTMASAGQPPPVDPNQPPQAYAVPPPQYPGQPQQPYQPGQPYPGQPQQPYQPGQPYPQLRQPGQPQFTGQPRLIPPSQPLPTHRQPA